MFSAARLSVMVTVWLLLLGGVVTEAVEPTYQAGWDTTLPKSERPQEPGTDGLLIAEPDGRQAVLWDAPAAELSFPKSLRLFFCVETDE
ncbi:MAG: hypothetical protein ACOY3P_02775, partial [Planctomycetota bacterium]